MASGLFPMIMPTFGQDSISAPQSGGIIRLSSMILVVLFSAEVLGAILLCPVFSRDFGIGKGIWFAVFHSVSAMCNAGFDLLGERGAYSSLVSYGADPVVNDQRAARSYTCADE